MPYGWPSRFQMLDPFPATDRVNVYGEIVERRHAVEMHTVPVGDGDRRRVMRDDDRDDVRCVEVDEAAVAPVTRGFGRVPLAARSVAQEVADFEFFDAVHRLRE